MLALCFLRLLPAALLAAFRCGILLFTFTLGQDVIEDATRLVCLCAIDDRLGSGLKESVRPSSLLSAPRSFSFFLLPALSLEGHPTSKIPHSPS